MFSLNWFARNVGLAATIFVLFSSAAWSQEDMPAGPPWQNVCEPMERESITLIFSKDQSCTESEASFYDQLRNNDVATVHDWMITNHQCIREWAHFSWLVFADKTEPAAAIGWRHQLFITHRRMVEGKYRPDGVTDHDIPYADRVATIESMLERGTTSTVTPDSYPHTDAYLDLVEQDTSFKEKMDKAYDYVTPICMYHLNLECIGAMRLVLDWMYPRSFRAPVSIPESATVSMIPFMRIVFKDTLTSQYASALALHLLHLIESGDYLNSAVPSFYDLALPFFKGDQQRFWQFMSIYATRGAALGSMYPLAHEETKPLFASLMVISAAMGVLDTHQKNSGTSFSYARGTVNSCFQPKPYHYWMSGSYAFMLQERGYSKRTVRLVSRLMGALYEVGSTTTGRDPDAIYFVDTFSTPVNRVRREIAHHYLGTELGLSGGRSVDQSFDATLKTLMDNSKALPEVSDDVMADRIKDSKTRWDYWTKLVGYYSLPR